MTLCADSGSSDFLGKLGYLNVSFIVIWDTMVFKKTTLHKVTKMKACKCSIIIYANICEHT